MSDEAALTHEATLLWLNDRLGKNVSVSLMIHRGDFSTDLLTAEGVLNHWREGEGEDSYWSVTPRDDISGLYMIGAENGLVGAIADTHLNLTRLGGLGVHTRNLPGYAKSTDELVIQIADDVELSIIVPG